MNTRNTYKLPSFFGFYVTQNAKSSRKATPVQFKGICPEDLDYCYER